MKKSTMLYLILLNILFLKLIMFVPIVGITILSFSLFFYLLTCFLEIYKPYKKEIYGDGYFEHTILKPKYNIIYKINKLID